MSKVCPSCVDDVCPSCVDDKRYLLPDAINSLAYGYCNIVADD